MPAGIVSFGGCVPLKRMSRDMLAQAWGGRSNGGGKAVANHDEDAITLSVAAARDVMGGRDPASIDAYYFASTTSPYAEKASSTVAALALQLRRDVETAAAHLAFGIVYGPPPGSRVEARRQRVERWLNP